MSSTTALYLNTGDAQSTTSVRSRIQVAMAFQLTSIAFKNDGIIPERFTRFGTDESPELAWNGAPTGTQSFALVVEDTDAKPSAHHWLLWNISSDKGSLAQGVPKLHSLPDGSEQGENDFGMFGYSGPCRPRGATHHYVFTLYALNSKLVLPIGARGGELTKALEGHVLAQAQLVGTFILPRWKSRKLALKSDKEFVDQTDNLQQKLKAAYSENPQVVSAFFRRFSLTSAFVEGKIQKFLDKVKNELVRQALDDYVKYANRFRVQFHLKTNPVEFKWLSWPSYGEKFHVKVVGDHLEPAKSKAHPDDPIVESFRSDDLKIPKAAQDLINSGKATFVQIDDGDSYSLLKGIEDFAYKDDGVAFFHHKAEQPYLGCIFGEQMSKQLLAEMGKTLTEFQKKHFSRATGGRPTDIAQMNKLLEVDKKPISNKAKAAELAEGGDEKKVKTQEVRLSKFRAKQRSKKR